MTADNLPVPVASRLVSPQVDDEGLVRLRLELAHLLTDLKQLHRRRRLVSLDYRNLLERRHCALSVRAACLGPGPNPLLADLARAQRLICDLPLRP